MKKGFQWIKHAELKKLVKLFCELLRKRIPFLKSIVIFGSIARGEEKRVSDLDLILVSDSFPENPSEAINTVVKVFKELKETAGYKELVKKGYFLNIDPVAYRPEDLEVFPPLLLDVVEDGILLYDDGFMEIKLKELKERLERLGAKKIKTKKGWYWDLKPGSKFGEVIEI